VWHARNPRDSSFDGYFDRFAVRACKGEDGEKGYEALQSEGTERTSTLKIRDAYQRDVGEVVDETLVIRMAVEFQ